MTTAKKESKKEKQSVLIVDDEPSLLDIYATKLSAEGYGVLLAKDGIEGYEMAVYENPSAILLDVILPLKNGFDVLKDLKANPRTRAIPVIILSNLGQEYEVKRGLQLGAAGFLVKANLTPGQVTDVLQKVLKERPAG